MDKILKTLNTASLLAVVILLALIYQKLPITYSGADFEKATVEQKKQMYLKRSIFYVSGNVGAYIDNTIDVNVTNTVDVEGEVTCNTY